jgi:hypothetical protein
MAKKLLTQGETGALSGFGSGRAKNSASIRSWLTDKSEWILPAAPAPIPGQGNKAIEMKFDGSGNAKALRLAEFVYRREFVADESSSEQRQARMKTV